MVDKIEQPIEAQPQAKPAKVDKKKPAKKPKPQKQKDDMYLPVLVEFTFTSSVIFLILVFVAITAVSWWTGASLLDFVLRTGIAMGVLGSLLMAVSRQVSAGVLSASQAEIEAELQKSLQDELDHAKSPPAIENAEQPEESGSDVMVENSEMEEIPATVEAQ